MLRCLSDKSLLRNLGIFPKKLFRKRSISSNPLNIFNDKGTAPSNELPSKYKCCKLRQVSRVVGICPDKLLSEKSSSARFFKWPTSNGSVPIKKLWDKTKEIEREETPITWFGMLPVRLFNDRFSISKLWQFLGLGVSFPQICSHSFKAMSMLLSYPRRKGLAQKICYHTNTIPLTSKASEEH